EFEGQKGRDQVVVGREGVQGEEGAVGWVVVVAVHAVPATVRGAQRRDRAGRVPAGGEEVVLERVLRIRHVVRRDIRVARLDRNGLAEREVLPAVRVAPVEGAGRGGPSPRPVPQVAGDGSGADAIHANPGDVHALRGRELDAELDAWARQVAVSARGPAEVVGVAGEGP